MAQFVEFTKLFLKISFKGFNENEYKSKICEVRHKFESLLVQILILLLMLCDFGQGTSLLCVLVSLFVTGDHLRGLV